jgi:hypothetical protein
MAYAETIFPVQGKHIAAFVIGSATGEMTLPFIISSLFLSPGPIIMIRMVAGATCINMLVYVALVHHGSALKAAIDLSSKYRNEKHEGA